MRIGIFSESYEPVQNGVTTSVRTLVEELRARKHHVSILAPRFPNYSDSSPFVIRVPSVQTPWNIDYPLPYPWFPRLRREFSRIHRDILHSQSPFFLGLLALRLSHLYDIPLVSTYHTLYAHYGHYLFFLPDRAINNLLDWWMPEYYNRCSAVIVPSEIAADNLRSYGVESAITVIPTAVPLPGPDRVNESARQKVRALWGIPPDAPLLLYVGRIAQEKNLEMLLQSFEAVGREFREARLLIVGGGPYLDTCTELATGMEVGGRVIFGGPIPHDDLPPIYAAADLFVFGSVTETQGLVIAEARAAGTPAVVADQGGASETVRHDEDGFVVPAEVEAFSAAISALLREPARLARMRESCLRNAREHTPSAMAERVLAVYEQARETKRIKTVAGASR